MNIYWCTECVTHRAALDTSIFYIHLDVQLLSINSNDMILLTKAIVAFLLACLSISAAALPSDGTLALDDPLPLNDTLPVNDYSSGDDTISLDDTPPPPPPDRGPPREGWKSAWIMCTWEPKPLWFNFEIYGEGYFGREESIEGKVKKAADRTGSVTKWRVAHYPPVEDRKSNTTITVSPPVPFVIASCWCSYYCLSLRTDILPEKFRLPIWTEGKLEHELGRVFRKKIDCI